MIVALRVVGLVAMLAVIAWAATATFVAWDKHVEHEAKAKVQRGKVYRAPACASTFNGCGLPKGGLSEGGLD